MMHFSFDMNAVERWAAFSGDYNPIHFDLSAARAAGADALIVHGMLVLLPVKQALTRRLLELPGLGKSQVDDQAWVRVRCSLKKLVPQDIELQLSFKETGEKIGFMLTPSSNDATYVQGHLDRRIPEPSEKFSEIFTIDAHTISESWKKFQSNFPAVSEIWIFLDALIFAQFIKNCVPLIVKMITGTAQDWSIEDGLGETVMVQMSHTVWFRADLSDSQFAFQGSDLEFGLHEFDSQVDGNKTFGTVVLSTSLNRSSIMRHEIGLMMFKR
jgi:hypothetical protein